MTNLEYIQSCTKEELADLLCAELKTDCFVCVASEYCHSGRNGFYDWLDKKIEDLEQPEIIRCKDCKYNVSSHKCLHPESFFLVPDDDFYCGYAERRTDDDT